jgi:PAS domain S-box-containing protein
MDSNELAFSAQGAHYDALVRSLLLTAARTGRDALIAMIDHLGTALHARRAHVSVPAPERADWFEVLAHWPEADEGEKLIHRPNGTVVAEIWRRGEVSLWHNLAEAFPAQRDFFARWQVDSVLGLRLDDTEGRPLGVILVAFGEDPPDRNFAATLVRVFALRAVGELMRLRAETERFGAERRRLEAEAALAAQETRFTEVLEHTEDAVFLMRIEEGPRFVFERVNSRLAEIAGLRAEQFVGRAPGDVFPSAWAERIYADGLACLNAGRPITHEREFTLENRGVLACRVSMIPSRDVDGRISRIMGIATDLTDLWRQRRIFADSEQIARLGGWELDCATGAILWTPGTFRIFERDPEEFVPTVDAVVELYTEDCRPAVRAALDRAARRGGDFEFVATARLDSGRLIHVRSLGRTVLVDGRVVRLCGAVQDVTDQEEAHEQRLRLEAQLRRAQKMEAIGTLAGGIAHDFNNILAGIMGNTQLAMLDVNENAPTRRFLDNAYQGCLRARDLVRRILTFSRQAEQPRTVAPLRPIIEEALELLRATLPSSVLIVTRFASEDLHVLVDPGQIHQVLINLGTNAAQAMRPAGGTLSVELAPSDARDEWHRRHPQVRPELRVRLTVRDTGPGIPPALLDRIFEPFFTTKPVGEGSGLGLAMVHGIVENHGGVIIVESAVGRGAAFHAFLPGQVRAGGVALIADEAGAVTPGEGQTILVVDDEPSITELVEPILRHLGYQTRAFNDAHVALASFATAPDLFTALLCDLTMPGLDGVTLARSVRTFRPDLPVVIMTGHLRPADLAPMHESGLHYHLPKPFSVQGLAAVLAEALGVPDAPPAS